MASQAARAEPAVSDLYISLLIGAGFFAFYLSFLSKAYVFEGLARALPIDTHHFNHLFAGNYLLYGVLGQAFHRMLQILGARNPAYISLQILDTLYGAVGLSVFYFSLRRLGAVTMAAAVWTCGLGVTLGYWLWSTDAENYIFSTLLLQILFFGLLGENRASRPSPARIGLLHGLACLGHIVNVMMVLPCLWILLYRAPAPKEKILGAYFASLIAVVGGAYALTILFIKNIKSPLQILAWFLGSASGGTQNLMHWHGGLSGASLAQWLKMTLHIFVATPTPYSHPAPFSHLPFLIALARICMAFLTGLFILKFKDILKNDAKIVIACLLWLFSYALIFTSWEPGTMVYRISDLIPLVTLLFLASRSVGAIAIGMAFFVSLGFANFLDEIYPRSFASNNAAWVRMQLIKSVTHEKDWIAVEGGTDELYVPYFAQRQPFLISRFHAAPDQLRSALSTLSHHGQRVFITSRLLVDPEWKSFFENWPLREVAHDQEGYRVYEL